MILREKGIGNGGTGRLVFHREIMKESGRKEEGGKDWRIMNKKE